MSSQLEHQGPPTPGAESACAAAVSRACGPALTKAFTLLGKRWNGMILHSLSPGPAGFAELRRALATITDSVLSDRLTELAAAGLVERSVTDARPPGVSYALTPSGVALLPVLAALSEWASANLDGPGGC